MRTDAEFNEVAARATRARGVDVAVYVDEFFDRKKAEARARFDSPAAPAAEGPVDPAVKRFRAMLE